MEKTNGQQIEIESFSTEVCDMLIEDYHSAPGISRSNIMELLRSPAHYVASLTREDTQTKEKIFGNALHTYLLEPEKFKKRFYVCEKMDRRTKEGKQKWENANFIAGHKTVIFEEDLALIKEFDAVVEKDAKLKQILRGGQNEKSIFWRDDETGVLCKCRPDVWQESFVCDVKTAASASEEDFQRAILKYGYHIQMAMIQEAIYAHTNTTIDMFVFVVFEKSDIIVPAIYILDDAAIEEGRKKFKQALRLHKECLAANDWPGYGTKTVSLPPYAFSREI